MPVVPFVNSLSFSSKSTILFHSFHHWAEPCEQLSSPTWVCLQRALEGGPWQEEGAPTLLAFGHSCSFYLQCHSDTHPRASFAFQFWPVASCSPALTLQLRDWLCSSTTRGTWPLCTGPHPPCLMMLDTQPWRERSPSMFVSSLTPNPTARNFHYSPPYRRGN